jgi:hypothetical protein
VKGVVMALTEEERRERANARTREWRLKNKARVKEYNRMYEKNNRERINRIQRGFNARHADRLASVQRDKARLQRKYLSDQYIKEVLCGNGSHLTYKHIPQSLVEAKRAELKLIRLIKEQEDGKRKED